MQIELKANPRYLVEKSDPDSNVQGVILTQSFPQREPVTPKPIENSFPLRSKVPIMSWDPSPSFHLSKSSMQRFTIPRCPLRRLRPWHRAVKGTTDEYAGRLLKIFPELADVKPEELEKTFRRIRGKEELKS